MEHFWFKRDLEKRLQFVPGLPVLVTVLSSVPEKSSSLKNKMA
jgi:hypothetical protein